MKQINKYILFCSFTLIFLSLNFVIYSQTTLYNYGSSSGSVNSGTGTHSTGATFFPAPSQGTFFYGFSSNASSNLSGVNPGLLRVGTETEAQASAGIGSSEFTKFGLYGYATANLKSSYTKFDIVLSGNTGLNTSNTGTWYFFVGDGGSGQFMYNNTSAMTLSETAVALRWTFGNNGSLATDYYDYVIQNWVSLTSSLTQTTKYVFEIYANLETSTTYSREGVSYTCAQNKMDIWINDVMIGNQINVSALVNQSGGLKKLDSWCFYGTGSNTAYIFTDQATSSGGIGEITTISYYSKSSGFLNELSTWGRNTDGSGTNPSNFSENLCTYKIRNNSTPTINSAWVVSGIDSKVELGDGTNACSFSVPQDYVFTGVLDVFNNGLLKLQNLTAPTFSLLLNGSTVEYAYPGNQTISYPVFYNLKISNSGIKSISTNVTSTGTVTVGDGVNSGTLTIPSSYTLTGTANIQNAGTLNISNSVNPNFGVISNGSTIEFSGSGFSQTTPAAELSFYNLKINNSNGVTLGHSSVIRNNLELTSGTLNIGDRRLTFINGNNPISKTSGYIQTNTSTELVFGTSGNTGGNEFTFPENTFQSSPEIKSFTINRTNSLIFTQNINATDTLNMTSGNLYFKHSSFDNLLTLGSSTSKIGILNYNSGVIVGRFKRYIASAAANYLFPIGTGVFYNGVYVMYTSGPTVGGSLTSEFIISDPGSQNGSNPIIDNSSNPPYTIDTYSRYGYWKLTNEGSTGVYTVNFCANGFSGLSSDDTKRANIRVIKRDNSSSLWQAAGIHASATGTLENTTAKRTTLNSYSEYALGSNANDNTFDGALPVLLSSFQSNLLDNNLELKWITNFEQNNSRFDIERKDKSDSWHIIGTVQGKGNSNTEVSYTYNDKLYKPGNYEYRLKQIDYNGNYEYHYLNVAIEFTNPKKFEMLQNYPNPFNPLTNIEIRLTSECFVLLKIYDITGKEISTVINEKLSPGYYLYKFNSGTMSSGIYYYRMTAGDFTSTKKMMILR